MTPKQTKVVEDIKRYTEKAILETNQRLEKGGYTFRAQVDRFEAEALECTNVVSVYIVTTTGEASSTLNFVTEKRAHIFLGKNGGHRSGNLYGTPNKKKSRKLDGGSWFATLIRHVTQ